MKKVCINGHTFSKTSDCPTCPVCEELRKPQTGFFATLSAPARRALELAGITSITKLATYTEKDILALHGMGPSSLPILRNALREAQLSFSKGGEKKL